jgi:hypothetical protein
MARRAFLVALAFGVGYGIDFVWARLVRGVNLERVDYPKFVLGRFRVHHSVVGYLAVVAGLFVYPAVLVPLGAGIIVGHGMRERMFGFIESTRE